MMYTSPTFESEEAARSQVEPLQNDHRLLSGKAAGGPSFEKGLAAVQTLHPVMGVSYKPAC